MIYTGASIRELQLARGLITLRWTSIPLLFGFSLFCLDFLNLSFKFEPIYLLCCALAIFNVYFTVHVSLLSRQMALNSGMSTLKRGLVRIAFEPMSIIRKKGVLGIIAIPRTAIKLIVCMYLMLLEAMKDVPFNPFSIKNIIKTQIVVDLAIILLLVRFTGTTESPVLLLTAVPVLVAGAISGVKTGFFFAFLTTFAWLTTGFMVKHQIIPHIKFYSPVYGDLSQCTEWIYANSSVLFFTLCSVAFLGNRITNYLNQRISSLNSLLFESNTRAYASNFASEQQKDAWLITDEKTNIEKIKIDSRHFFSPSVLGLNLRETYSELESKLTDVFIKNLIENRQRCRVEKVKLQSSEDKSYVFDICLTSFIDCDDKNKLLLFFEDNTVEENSKTKVIELKNEIQALNEKLENLNNENTKNNNLIINLQDTINSRIVDMELLNKKISDLTLTRIENERNISELISELAGVKASNDEMIATLECKQMLLNEAATLIDFCGNLTELIKKIESNTKELFSLKNSHLHIFTSENLEERYEEIITLEHFQTTTSALTKAGPSLLTLKNVRRGRIAEYAQKYKEATYIPHDGSATSNPLWDVKADYAFPCATQNEINANDARNLTANKIQLVGEGANMPTTLEAKDILMEAGVLLAPGKASNAGGVAVSGLEMVQNSQRLQWTPAQVDAQLLTIMKNIYANISSTAEKYSTKNNFIDGANIAGFLKISEAMIGQGYV